MASAWSLSKLTVNDPKGFQVSEMQIAPKVLPPYAQSFSHIPVEARPSSHSACQLEWYSHPRTHLAILSGDLLRGSPGSSAPHQSRGLTPDDQGVLIVDHGLHGKCVIPKRSEI